LKNNKLIKIYFGVLCFLVIIFTNCSNTRILSVNNNSPYINYEKVKLKLNINKSSYSIKGFIYIIKDTSFCFRFWGPLGYEVGHGRIDSNFLFFDAINNIVHRDLKNKIETNTGLIITRNLLLNMLTGNIDSLSSELVKNNRGIVDISSQNNLYLEINHLVSLQKMSFKYSYNKNRLKNIFIKSTGKNTNLFVNIEILGYSNDKKICRFTEF
jgi:hypothetical protein